MLGGWAWTKIVKISWGEFNPFPNFYFGFILSNRNRPFDDFVSATIFDTKSRSDRYIRVGGDYDKVIIC